MSMGTVSHAVDGLKSIAVRIPFKGVLISNLSTRTFSFASDPDFVETYTASQKFSNSFSRKTRCGTPWNESSFLLKPILELWPPVRTSPKRFCLVMEFFSAMRTSLCFLFVGFVEHLEKT